MTKTKATESDENILYDPRKVFRLSAKWRLAIINGWLKGKTKPLTNEERMRLIEKQKYLDMVKEILHAMGKVPTDENNEYYKYLLDGYCLVCDNVWQRFKEIDDSVAQSTYTVPKQLKLPAHKRTMVDSIPYYKQDLEDWLNAPNRSHKVEKYRNFIEQIPTLLKWRDGNHYLYFGRPDDLSLYEPFDDAVAFYICILHRDCANMICLTNDKAKSTPYGKD